MWKDNIKKYLEEIVFEDVRWTEQAQNGVQGCTVVNTVMKLRFQQKRVSSWPCPLMSLQCPSSSNSLNNVTGHGIDFRGSVPGMMTSDISSRPFPGAGIAQRYTTGLRAGWPGVRVPAGAGNFSLHHRVQTGSGVLPVYYPMGSRVSFPGGEAAGAWSWPLLSI
jgi:hypothetical protein